MLSPVSGGVQAGLSVTQEGRRQMWKSEAKEPPTFCPWDSGSDSQLCNTSPCPHSREMSGHVCTFDLVIFNLVTQPGSGSTNHDEHTDGLKAAFVASLFIY